MNRIPTALLVLKRSVLVDFRWSKLLAATALAITVVVVMAPSSRLPQTGPARESPGGIWSLGYWTPGGNPPIPPADIEWGGLTHVVHAWALVNADGSLDLHTQRVSSDGSALIAKAHAAGVKALLGIGQPYWLGQKRNLREAATLNRAALVKNIMSVVNDYGFDGVDIDWEPFDPAADGKAMKQLAAGLRSSLGERSLSAAAIVTDYAYWGREHRFFDRIGAMTYDLTGTWNPYTWHNAALYGEGQVWSVDLAVKRFTEAGVPAAKLCIGIPFFGWEWTGGGVIGPRSRWSGDPRVRQVYYQSFAGALRASSYRWDPMARVPYLSAENHSGTPDALFLTYDNEDSIREKVKYAKSKRLGGWIIWELFGDYSPTSTPKQPLLNVIKNTMSEDDRPQRHENGGL